MSMIRRLSYIEDQAQIRAARARCARDAAQMDAALPAAVAATLAFELRRTDDHFGKNVARAMNKRWEPLPP